MAEMCSRCSENKWVKYFTTRKTYFLLLCTNTCYERKRVIICWRDYFICNKNKYLARRFVFLMWFRHDFVMCFLVYVQIQEMSNLSVIFDESRVRTLAELPCFMSEMWSCYDKLTEKRLIIWLTLIRFKLMYQWPTKTWSTTAPFCLKIFKNLQKFYIFINYGI